MIIQKPVTSFFKGRCLLKPDMIVLHIGEGSQQAIYNTFLNPGELKSSHYCVSKTGEVWQFVKEEDTAWANGKKVNPTNSIVLSRPNTNPNLYTISIEHEGFGTQDLTEAQYKATAELVKDICTRWDIPLTRTNNIRHNEIRGDKTCPGLMSVEKVLALASDTQPVNKVEEAKKLLQKALNLLS